MPSCELFIAWGISRFFSVMKEALKTASRTEVIKTQFYPGEDMSEDTALLVDHEEGNDELLELPWELDHRQQEVNYGRLCTLIIREGTKRLRDYTKQNLERGAQLEDVLKVQAVQNIFLNLKKGRKLAPHQYRILYPEDGSKMQEKNIDISLWVVLARNLVKDRSLINWDKTPGEDDDLHPHHVLRIRDARNKLHHMSHNELTSAVFEKMWNGIAHSLSKLGSHPQDLHRIKISDLDPESTRICVYEVQQQALVDQCDKLEAEASNKHWLLRAFIVLLALFVVAFVAIIIVVVLYSKEHSCSKNLLIVKTVETLMQFMPRSGWGARDPEASHMRRFHGPVEYMAVSQSALNGNCVSHDGCCQAVKTVQDLNMDVSGFSDVAFNYLIGGDGVAYEGRGQFYMPATVPTANSKLLSMAFVGYFADNKPTTEALNAGKILIQYLVDIGALTHNATVLGLCQMYGKKYPRSPGVAIMEEMKHWKGNGWSWKPINVTDCEGVSNVTDLLNIL